MKWAKLLTATAVGGFLMASPAQAGITTFFGEDLNSSPTTPLAAFPNASSAEASFLASLTGVGTEDFESFASGTGAPLNLSFPGAGTATLGGSGSIVSVTAGSTNGFGRYGTSPTKYWEVDAGSFSISFGSPIAAFGFFGIDIGDFGEQLEITLNDVAGTSLLPPYTIGSSGSTDGSVMFFGFIGTTVADTFTQVTFSTSSGSGDVFAFDDMTIGSLQQVTPRISVPGALGLFVVGLGLLGAVRRKLIA